MLFRTQYWKKTTVVILLVFTFVSVRGDILADIVDQTRKERAYLVSFADNLGLDMGTLTHPETTDERREQIRLRREEAIARLRDQICRRPSPAELAEIQDEFDAVKDSYLPERIAGLAKTVRDLEARLDLASAPGKAGNENPVSSLDLRLYAEAMELGARNLQEYQRLLEKNLAKNKIPEEIAERSRSFQALLETETTNLGYALKSAVTAEAVSGKATSSDVIESLRSQVKGAKARISEEINRSLGDRVPSGKGESSGKDGKTEVLTYPFAGGSGSGGGGGSGGSGGDDASTMRKIRQALQNASRPAGSGGSSDDPVDYGTGELSVDQYDIGLPTVGDVAGIIRRYRSQNERIGPLGYGWFHNYSLSIEVDMNDNVVLLNDDGRQFVFPKIAEGEYGPPEEMEASIAPDGDGFLLRTGGKWNLRFNSQGVLEWRGDNYGNRLVMIYDGGGHLDTVQNATGEVLLNMEVNPQGLISQVTDRGGRSLQYEYDEDANLTGVTNPDGGKWSFTYFDDHNLATMTDPDGNTTMNFYDDSDRVMRQLDPNGHEEVFSYDFIHGSTIHTDKNGYDRRILQDEKGRVVESLDAEGNRVTYTHDERGRKTSETNAAGETTTFEYGDDCGSCGVTRMLEPDGTETLMDYGPHGLVSKTVNNPSGKVQSTTQTFNDKGEMVSYKTFGGETMNLEYNSAGQVVRQTSDSGQDVRFTYDPTGVRTGQTHILPDADGNPTEMKVDLLVDESGLPVGHQDGAGHGYVVTTNGRGLPREISQPGSSPVRVAYNKSGLVASVTGASGFVTSFEYDRLNQNTAVVMPNGERRRIGYDPVGNVTSRTNEDRSTTQYEFNAARQRIRTTDANGNVTDLLYCGEDTDAKGLVGPTGDSSIIERDDRNRIVSITDDLGATTRFEYASPYDEGPSLTEDPLGNATRYEYDGNGRLLKVTDANDNETVYEYTGSQRWPSRITDAAGHQWGYTFDPLGRLTRKTDPLGNTTKYYYDESGNRVREVDAEGSQSTFTYDPRNRLIAAGFPDGTTESYTYDGPLLMAEGNSETRNVYEYDEAGRRTKVATYPLGRTLTYAYTPSGRVKTETVAGVGTTTYHYDAVGNVSAIDYPSEGTVRYEYDEADRRSRILYPNGAYALYSYDLVGRVSSLIHYDPDNVPLAGQTYTYDKAGNIKEIRDHTGKRKGFSYDPLYRLVEVREDDVKVEGFTYDTVGNVTSHYLEGVETAYQYDNADRMIRESRPGETVDYTYDKVGNLIQRTASDGTTAYQYDGKNRLEWVELPGGTTVSYGYNTENTAVARTEDGKRTDYLLDGNSVHSDYSDGDLESFYLRGAELDELHGVSQPGKKATYLHQDRLNTVMAGSGEFGESAGQRRYRAYGSMNVSTGLSTRYGYAGRELDESTGLMNFRSRWYSPEMGRFISPDRAGGELSIPLSLNRYAYAHDNPILNNDPLGYGMFSDAVGIGYNMAVSIASNLVSCYSPIAAAVLGFYDVYFAMINSLCDLLFDYDGVAGSNCALGLLPLMFYLAGFMVVLAAATWTSCANELWKTFVKSLIAEAATNIGEYIAKKLGGAAGLGAYGIIVRILLAYGKALEGFGIGVSVFKFFMAPELLIGFCVLIGLR